MQRAIIASSGSRKEPDARIFSAVSRSPWGLDQLDSNVVIVWDTIGFFNASVIALNLAVIIQRTQPDQGQGSQLVADTEGRSTLGPD
jgi:hypothetical protein